MRNDIVIFMTINHPTLPRANPINDRANQINQSCDTVVRWQVLCGVAGVPNRARARWARVGAAGGG